MDAPSYFSCFTYNGHPFLFLMLYTYWTPLPISHALHVLDAPSYFPCFTRTGRPSLFLMLYTYWTLLPISLALHVLDAPSYFSCFTRTGAPPPISHALHVPVLPLLFPQCFNSHHFRKIDKLPPFSGNLGLLYGPIYAVFLPLYFDHHACIYASCFRRNGCLCLDSLISQR